MAYRRISGQIPWPALRHAWIGGYLAYVMVELSDHWRNIGLNDVKSSSRVSGLPPKRAMLERNKKYIDHGLYRVEGWLDTYSARFVSDILIAQGQAGLQGAFGEIGVHHGKLFLAMMTATEADLGFALDVFEDQHLNVDQSGAGDRARFIANIRAWAGSDTRVRIFQKSSLDIRPKEIVDAVGLCRMVSIDGGHSEECTLSDLRTAEAVMHDYGVVILDDCFNEDWPDVVSGVARYCFDETSRLRPFALCPNKVFFAKPDHHALIIEILAPFQGQNLRRHNRMFGYDVAIFGTPDRSAEVVQYAFAHPRRIVKYILAQPDKTRTALTHAARLWLAFRSLVMSRP
jgi:hypothetical protein